MSAGDKPLVPFEIDLHISPVRLFRRLHEAREGLASAPVLLDLREAPGPISLRDARPFDENAVPDDRDVVLIDDTGDEALAAARKLHERGLSRVRALYGGLQLYDFALDPRVVGAERFLGSEDGSEDGSRDGFEDGA